MQTSHLGESSRAPNSHPANSHPRTSSEPPRDPALRLCEAFQAVKSQWGRGKSSEEQGGRGSRAFCEQPGATYSQALRIPTSNESGSSGVLGGIGHVCLRRFSFSMTMIIIYASSVFPVGTPVSPCGRDIWNSTGWMYLDAMEHSGGSILLKKNGNKFTSEERSNHEVIQKKERTRRFSALCLALVLRVNRLSFKATVFFLSFFELILSNHPAQIQNC